MPCYCLQGGSSRLLKALEAATTEDAAAVPGNAAPTDPAQHAAILNNPDMSAM